MDRVGVQQDRDNREARMTQLSNAHKIIYYLHCELCIREKPDDKSPREWQSIEAGWTETGFQVWCKRHNCNIVHVDFQGQQHPANTTRQK